MLFYFGKNELKMNCQNKKVITISFANNNIETLQPFHQLPKFVHSTLNLSFDGNPIKSFEELDSIKGLKIREIELKNTPLKAVPEAKYQR
jgi:hypothetical protein